MYINIIGIPDAFNVFSFWKIVETYKNKLKVCMHIYTSYNNKIKMQNLEFGFKLEVLLHFW